MTDRDPRPCSYYFLFIATICCVFLMALKSRLRLPRPALFPHTATFLSSFTHTLPRPQTLSLPLRLLCSRSVDLLPVVPFSLILSLSPWCLAELPAQLHLPARHAKHILSFQIKPQKHSPPPRQAGRGSNLFLPANVVY